MAGVTWWSALSVGLALTRDPGGSLGTLIGRLEWFGIAVIAVGLVRWALATSGRDDYLSNRGVAALLAVPFAWTVVGFAHPDVVELTAATVPPLAAGLRALAPLVPLYVWLNPVVIAGVYLALAVGTAMLLETAFERPAVGPRRLLTIVMVLPPWALNVLYLAELTPTGGYDPTVLGFVVTGVAGLVAIDRFRLFETPFVRSEVVEELDTPVMAFGADDRLYDYNARAASVFGLDSDDLDDPLDAVLERTPLGLDVPAGVSPATVVDRIDGSTATAETPDGDERYYLVTTTELSRGDGRPLGYAVQCSDVTRQRRQRDRVREKSRRLERKNEQLERLAGIVAHDMETPVATGQRLLELLRLDVDTGDEAVAQTLDDLELVFDRLDGFAEHLPRLARESVDVETPVDCDLETVAEDAWRVVDTGDLRLDVARTTTLEADPQRLRQAFENLFRNVAEHGCANLDPSDPARATVVRVGTLGGDAAAGDAADEDATPHGFYVADDGPGIPAERRDDVLAFGDGDGTGYGLAIVRTIVEAHGWTVSVTESADAAPSLVEASASDGDPVRATGESSASATGQSAGHGPARSPGARFEIDCDP
jgi:signal transduction histidine kinase